MAKGGKSSLTGLNNVMVIMVRWRTSILSLGSGDGIPVLVGQNEVCQKWQNLYSTIQYNRLIDNSPHSPNELVQHV